MPTCKKCNTYFKNHQLIDGKVRNLCRRSFCLECSPFGTHNTRNLTKSTIESKTCPSCKEEKKASDFYTRKRGDLSSYCINCTSKETYNRMAAKKDLAIEYKGSCCCICGYNKCRQALEFHHLDPTTKEYDIARGLRSMPFEAVKPELDKCILVCCRCHREVEAGLISPDRFELPLQDS